MMVMAALVKFSWLLLFFVVNPASFFCHGFVVVSTSGNHANSVSSKNNYDNKIAKDITRLLQRRRWPSLQQRHLHPDQAAELEACAYDLMMRREEPQQQATTATTLTLTMISSNDATESTSSSSATHKIEKSPLLWMSSLSTTVQQQQQDDEATPTTTKAAACQGFSRMASFRPVAWCRRLMTSALHHHQDSK